MLCCTHPVCLQKTYQVAVSVNFPLSLSWWPCLWRGPGPRRSLLQNNDARSCHVPCCLAIHSSGKTYCGERTATSLQDTYINAPLSQPSPSFVPTLTSLSHYRSSTKFHTITSFPNFRASMSDKQDYPSSDSKYEYSLSDEDNLLTSDSKCNALQKNANDAPPLPTASSRCHEYHWLFSLESQHRFCFLLQSLPTLYAYSATKRNSRVRNPHFVSISKLTVS